MSASQLESQIDQEQQQVPQSQQFDPAMSQQTAMVTSQYNTHTGQPVPQAKSLTEMLMIAQEQKHLIGSLVKMKPQVDRKSPRQFNHLKRGYKNMQSERQRKIDQDNSHLLKKIMSVMNRKNNTFRDRTASPSKQYRNGSLQIKDPQQQLDQSTASVQMNFQSSSNNQFVSQTQPVTEEYDQDESQPKTQDNRILAVSGQFYPKAASVNANMYPSQVSMNQVARKREINRINQNNKVMLKALQDAKPSVVSRTSWKQHIQKQEQLKKNIHGHYFRYLLSRSSAPRGSTQQQLQNLNGNPYGNGQGSNSVELSVNNNQKLPSQINNRNNSKLVKEKENVSQQAAMQSQSTSQHRRKFSQHVMNSPLLGTTNQYPAHIARHINVRTSVMTKRQQKKHIHESLYPQNLMQQRTNTADVGPVVSINKCDYRAPPTQHAQRPKNNLLVYNNETTDEIVNVVQREQQHEQKEAEQPQQKDQFDIPEHLNQDNQIREYPTQTNVHISQNLKKDNTRSETASSKLIERQTDGLIEVNKSKDAFISQKTNSAIMQDERITEDIQAQTDNQTNSQSQMSKIPTEIIHPVNKSLEPESGYTPQRVVKKIKENDNTVNKTSVAYTDDFEPENDKSIINKESEISNEIPSMVDESIQNN